ncbi:MAG: hypothetical protein KC438_05270, partial [Thermomicrobiales bacterium]|nr:hypothetical protein [Thermomicrobiales bacterium]
MVSLTVFHDPAVDSASSTSLVRQQEPASGADFDWEILTPENLPALSAELFINRELSWLDFNARVLAEAKDPRVPLLERGKFLAIFSSNLDEFFMIRVAGVLRKVNAGLHEPSVDGRTSTALYLAIRERTLRLQLEQTNILNTELVPELERHGIVLT